jgi:hypothetical protein
VTTVPESSWFRNRIDTIDRHAGASRFKPTREKRMSNSSKIRGRGLRVLALSAAVAGATSAWAGAPVFVTSNADSGPGTLREALASGANRIIIAPAVGNIAIDSTLVYNGTAPLKLVGQGQTIVANPVSDDFTLLEIAEGANLTLRRLNFDGGGGFEFGNAGDGKGIYVQVPTARTGIVHVDIADVQVRGVANHGIHVSDCTLGDDCGSGGGGGGDGSPASIVFTGSRVTVDDAGNGKFDADGIRIDERADGGIVFNINGGRFVNVGADGVELDEGNDGDVIIDVRSAIFADNGGYCLPAPLDLAEPCVEDDDGDLVLDLDDGFDIDEAGPGSLLGRVDFSLVSDNLDEGLDFDVEGPGGADIQVRRVVATGNGDEGVKLSAAEGDGAVVDLFGLTVTGNGNDGIEIEAEDGDGTVFVTFANGVSVGNESDGLAVAQENTTDLGTLRILGFADIDSLDLENVEQQ